MLSRHNYKAWSSLLWRLTGCFLVSACAPLFAQDHLPLLPSSAVLDTRSIQPGERLSDWLLRQPADPMAYPLGLSWNVPSQRQRQAKLKHSLIAQLALSSELQVSPVPRQRLARWIKALPVTGRERVAIADPRWLQAHPDQDPILDYDHSVVLPRRPSAVTVITENGQRCRIPHRAGAEVPAYLNACQSGWDDKADLAWLIQPDGLVNLLKIAPWNMQAQAEPAPGARIWAPSRNSGWAVAFSTVLAEFLATQYPETDESGVDQLTVLPVLAETAAAVVTAHARDHVISANDWGLIGLLQTPSARMADAGEMRAQLSRVYPYGRTNVLTQPLDWLEAGFRYTNVSNVLYGPAAFSGDQAYKDKSVDFKVRLVKESAEMPQLALGMIDIGGTGLFSSEYLVASKRRGNFDWSLGIAWGYLGASGNIGNPLSSFGKGFDRRAGSTSATGGEVNTKSFFHGTTALFGGVQYQTPVDGLHVKLEYDGNNYRHEPLGNNIKQSSPINVGVVYRYNPSIDVTVGLERGNTAMLSVSFHGQMDRLFMPKVMDPPKPGVSMARPVGEPDWSRTAADLSAQTHWAIQQISRNGNELRIVLDEAYGVYWNERIDRAAAVLHRDAPADINRFVLVFYEHGLAMTERVILREPWVAKHHRYQAISERFEAIAATEPRLGRIQHNLWTADANRFSIGLAPSYQQGIGGPEGFILFQAGIATPMEYRFTDTTWLSGKANFRVVDNYNKIKDKLGVSVLPHVRTNVREYVTSSRLTLPVLQANHIGQLNSNQYYSAYAGFLEPMFAGVGGEWLYRPWHSPFAFGVDINRVQQRDFMQDFTLQDYRVNTGHATLYWDTGWKSTHVNLSAGQYLAGDRGITVEVSKTFTNGVSLGAWATKTNVSSQQFGEGSFDKGIYLAIPFEAMLPATSPSIGNFFWNPITRDGGARLGRSNTLYGLTSTRDKRLTRYASAEGQGAARLGLDDEGPEWIAERSIFGDMGQSTANFGAQVAKGNTGSALLMGSGIVAASSALDRPLARWASNHQTSRWNSLGKAANNMPLFLAGGTGLLWWGLGGEIASETAWTSIKSAALTVGTETLTKLMLGRARPDKELGPMNFTPFIGKGAANSSFPSIHLGAAYALVTPFAQQYDAAWLYGVAGVTALGRIQQRQHFASDVVAGGLIGYGVGSLLLEQQRNQRNGPRISVDANRNIQASWDF